MNPPDEALALRACRRAAPGGGETTLARAHPLPVAMRMRVARSALRALSSAWYVRTLRRPESMCLPATAPARAWNDELTPDVVAWIDLIVRACVFWRRHRCFYRAFALASVLRRGGLPIVLNLGYRGLHDRRSRQAHCWLTLDGALFFETTVTADAYPVRLGGIAGQIEYFVGSGAPR